MRTAIELNVAKRRIPPSDKDWVGINSFRTAQQLLYLTLCHTVFQLSPVGFGWGYLRGCLSLTQLRLQRSHTAFKVSNTLFEPFDPRIRPRISGVRGVQTCGAEQYGGHCSRYMDSHGWFDLRFCVWSGLW
jgi:hypothetical protein